MIRQIDLSAFLRNFKVYPKNQVAFFLGSGTSIQAGIPTGSDLVWRFKREIYCSQTGTSQEKFKDLQSETNQVILQGYFDAEGNNPTLYAPSEYSHYFEKCFPSILAREQYIKELVRDIKPSLGHLCLGDLIIKGKINNIWTTNFDELIEAGIKQLDPALSFRVLSYANKDSVNISDNDDFPNIYKLHGDYRYDRIKNTLREVQSLETVLNNKFEAFLRKGGLIMSGYSGSDESIMSVLERNLSNSNFLPYGLIWLNRKNTVLPDRTLSLIDKSCAINENSGIIDIDGFDEFMYSCYKIYSHGNSVIDEKWRDFTTRKIPIAFSSPNADYFIKLNTFESISYPNPITFDSDITSWKELGEIIGQNKTVAALYARKIYCFSSTESIRNVFNKHVFSEPQEENIPIQYLYRNDSFYTGMLYDLISDSLLTKTGIMKFEKNKFYNTTKSEISRDNSISYKLFDAIEFFLDFINGKYCLSILPTVFIIDMNGNSIENEAKKIIINKKMSTIWNSAYDEKIKEWNRLLWVENTKTISFESGGFNLRFNFACISYGKIDDQINYPHKTAYQLDEPVMLFNINNKRAIGINQLKGITNYGPIDYSYSKSNQSRNSIKLTVISPNSDLIKILNHLGKLKNESRLEKKDGFTPIYNGFENVYKQNLDIPQQNDQKRCILYDEWQILTREQLVNTLKSKIDILASEIQNFDILIIYIPQSFEQFRLGNEEEDFNLHDAIKLYAMDKAIKVQFIEEKSLNQYAPCKVMWALSVSLYAKEGGILWRPNILNTDTAFVGISYALSKEQGISVGCSQLFDASGTGLRLLLRKIKDPQFIKKNPFMKADEARQMMSTLREQYYKSNPASSLNRIVIHKTTFFTQDEIKGFTQTLEGIEDIELLQIQEFTSWRGIRYKDLNVENGVYNYSMKRGTVVQLSDDTYLLWTHGCILSDELWGLNKNYYKGGRGIPAPLLIKRFYGKATGDVLTNEILMLTKMNWNSGDSLYKNFPVTLDFAKVLSRMSKQNEALYDKLYDFRYFM